MSLWCTEEAMYAVLPSEEAVSHRDPMGITKSKLLLAIRNPSHALHCEEEKGEHLWDGISSSSLAEDLSRKSRKRNTSKSAWWKFWSFCVHPLLVQAGRASGVYGWEGVNVFFVSIVLEGQFPSPTASLERWVCACACEDQDSWEALLEGCWAQRASRLGHYFPACSGHLPNG